jgi:hypothetical protein
MLRSIMSLGLSLLGCLTAADIAGWRPTTQPKATTSIDSTIRCAVGLDRMLATYNGPTCRVNGVAIGVRTDGTFDAAAASAVLPPGQNSLVGVSVELAVQRPNQSTPLWTSAPAGCALPTLQQDAAGNWCVRFTGARALAVNLSGISFVSNGGASFTGLTVPLRRKESGAVVNTIDCAWSYIDTGKQLYAEMQHGDSVSGAMRTRCRPGGESSHDKAYTAFSLPAQNHSIVTISCGGGQPATVFRNGELLFTATGSVPSVTDQTQGTLRLGMNRNASLSELAGQDFLCYGLILSHRLDATATRAFHLRLAAQVGWRRSAGLGMLPMPDEVFDFGTASIVGGKPAIPGLRGKTDLVLNTAPVTSSKGAVYAPAMMTKKVGDFGIAGLYAGDFKNIANSFQATNETFADQWEWTTWIILELDVAAAKTNDLLDAIGMRSGPLTNVGQSGLYGIESPWTIGRHHKNWTAYTKPAVTIDTAREIGFEEDFRKWPCKVDVAPVVPDPVRSHDDWGNAHIFAYRDRVHLHWENQKATTSAPAMSVGDSDDRRGARVVYGVPYLVIMKHRPHPALKRSDPSTWRTYMQSSYVQIKAAPLTEVLAWEKLDCAVATRMSTGALAAPTPGTRITSFGRLHLPTSFQGYRYAAGFIGGRVTTDAEDLAIFYNGLRLAAYGAAPPPPPVPAALAGVDVGAPGTPGATLFKGGIYELSGCGTDIGGTADSGHMATAPASGDVVIQSRMLSLSGAEAEAGLLLRAGDHADAASASLVALAGGRVQFQRRGAEGRGTSVSEKSGYALPLWLRMVRRGKQCIGLVSADGVRWNQIGEGNVNLPDVARAGMGIAAHDLVNLGSARFSDWEVTAPTAAPPPGAWRINFAPQQAAAAVIAGETWLIDDGAAHGRRANGQAYGWNVPLGTGIERRSTLATDQRFDTLVRPPSAGNPTWSLALPNGWYRVTVCLGDAQLASAQVAAFTLEGVEAGRRPVDTLQRWAIVDSVVEVEDGLLHLSNAPGGTCFLPNWIEIVPTAMPGGST